MSDEDGNGLPPPWTGILAAAEEMRRQQAGLAERLRPVLEMRGTLLNRWMQANAPLMEAAERIRSAMAAFAPSSEVIERLEWLRREDVRCEGIEATGWMAHPSSPFHLIEDDGPLGEELTLAVEAYYREGWDAITAGMKGRVDACLIDDEAKATFAEALAAHGAGLFRCAPRVLFPELERVARKEIHGGAMDKMASQRGLQEAVGTLTPGQMAWSGTAGLRFYRKLTQHMYANLRDPEAVGTVAADPVPNRHAALHGYVSYAAANASFNALAGAEYLFLAISTLKAGAEMEAADGDADAASAP